jgi:hypothetical protein
LVSRPTVTDDLAADERWQLVQRIVSSAAFQKSTRLRELLQHISERTIHGFAQELTEQQIGEALFHKPSGYSPLEDSSVRVHVRQLRLKLHQYFDEEGRSELLIVEIPKGSYLPVFRAATKPAVPPLELAPVPAVEPGVRLGVVLPWLICAVLAISCVLLLFQSRTGSSTDAGARPGSLPWPFSQVFDKRHQTVIVVADSNYGMSRILASRQGSLDQYLQRQFADTPEMRRIVPAGSPFDEYISNSTLTSFADVADVVSLVKMSGALQSQVAVRYPRDLRIPDLDHENLIFIGSPASNPWVSLFQDKLNFRESEGAIGNSVKAFLNAHPQPGEKSRYEGLRWTGTGGEDYATIALVPNATHDGSVLILQGLQQEGTEAAGRFLTDEQSRQQLRHALGLASSGNDSENIWFEALIRSRTVSGAPNSTTLIAVRRIP